MTCAQEEKFSTDRVPMLTADVWKTLRVTHARLTVASRCEALYRDVATAQHVSRTTGLMNATRRSDGRNPASR